MLQITNYKLQITNYKLQITNYKLQITNYKFVIFFILQTESLYLFYQEKNLRNFVK
jgi:hypothetical protein